MAKPAYEGVHSVDDRQMLATQKNDESAMPQHLFHVTRIHGIAAGQTVPSQPKSPQPLPLRKEHTVTTTDLPAQDFSVMDTQADFAGGEPPLGQGSVDKLD